MALEHGLGPDADLVDHARPQVLDQNVRRVSQPMQLGDVVGRFQVEHDRALVAVLAVEIERGHAIRPERRAPDARIVAALGLLDLENVGAHVGQQHAGQRPGQRLAHLDDANSIQR
jgi:hypothetical protein